MKDTLGISPALAKLEMTRGDTFSFDLRMTDVEADSIKSLYFTIKKKATDSDADAIIQKSLDDGITMIANNIYRVRVAPEDTDNVPAEKYAYDIQIRINDDVYTLFRGSIAINQDVTEVT